MRTAARTDRGGGGAPPSRLGVYYDTIYHLVQTPEGPRVSSDRSFLLFVCAVGADFDRLVVFGRTVRVSALGEYVLPPDVELVELPPYSNLRRLGEVAAAAVGTVRGFWRGLDRVDTVWIFGPHPFAVVLAGLALVRRKRIVLGVRQHSVRLYATRLEGWRRVAGVTAMRLLDGVYRALGARVPVTVQGVELEEWYRGPRSGVLAMTESVVRASDVVETPLPRDWSGTLELLTVGRLEPEKNPLLLVDALTRLDRDVPGRYRLTWVGRGPLEHDVHEHAQRLGVSGLIDFIGYVPFDGGLLDLYRRAHVFVHVSLSEGMPKVLIEALASATPVVATDVGGVRAALADGSAGLLVPPDDLDALIAAVRRLEDDHLRERLVAQGVELVRGMTLEAEAARVVDFIRGGHDREKTAAAGLAGSARA